jgi:endonuclease I
LKKIFIIQLLIGLFFSNSFGQIPPGYYDNANGLSGNALKTALHNIIDDHQEYSYNDLRDFILMDTDEDPNNPNNVILLYTGRSQNKNTFGGGANDWNREHVWAKSHGDFGTTPPAGTDAHHLRPTDASVNSSRGNKDFAEGGQQHSEALGNYYTEYTWEPRDAVKGDVARMIFYMAVRYEGGSGEPDLEVVDMINTSPDPEHGKLSDLLQWNMDDPPDAFEINRNNVIYGYQNNRNPFIDHPEYVNDIWNPASVQDEYSIAPKLNVFPNPANQSITIDLDFNINSTVQISVINLMGQAVYNSNFTGEIDNTTIDVNQLDEGIYMLQLSNSEIFTIKKFQIIHQ